MMAAENKKNNNNSSTSRRKTSTSASTTSSNLSVVDIGINLTNRAFQNNWRPVLQRVVNAGVDRILLTGTSFSGSKEVLEMAQTWPDETGFKNLFCTVGVYPHDAKKYSKHDSTNTNNLKELLVDNPLAVAVGECGLDFNFNFSFRQDQCHAFREQAILACELKMPMFVRERDAHEDLVKILDEVFNDESCPSLPPIVIHCFTGAEQEAQTYIEREYLFGFAGTICKKDRGAPLRDMIPRLPLDRIMIETDALFMGYRKGRRSSEPVDVVDVAKRLSEVYGLARGDVCETTTNTATSFFNFSR